MRHLKSTMWILTNTAQPVVRSQIHPHHDDSDSISGFPCKIFIFARLGLEVSASPSFFSWHCSLLTPEPLTYSFSQGSQLNSLEHLLNTSSSSLLSICWEILGFGFSTLFFWALPKSNFLLFGKGSLWMRYPWKVKTLRTHSMSPYLWIALPDGHTFVEHTVR